MAGTEASTTTVGQPGRYISHKALMQIDPLRKDHAHFIVAHNEVIQRSTDFYNRGFGKFEDNSFIVVSFQVNAKRRKVIFTAAFSEAIPSTKQEAQEQFLAKFKDDLMAEINRVKAIREIADEANVIWTVGKKPIIPPSSVEPEAVIPRTNAEWVSGIYVASELLQAFKTATKLIESGGQINVMMVGPSGYGKTSIPEAMAEANGMKFHRVNCAAVRDPEQWFGYPEARDGETVFERTELTKIIEDGNAVIVLDEYNRVEPWMHNILFPLLDHARRTTIHNYDVVCGDGIIFVATMNMGFQYTGTFAMDQAMTNRFDLVLKVGPLPANVETALLVKRTEIDSELAKLVVKAMRELRELAVVSDIGIDASTRTSLKISRLMSSGLMSMSAAFAAVIINTVDEEAAKRIIDTVSLVTSISR